MLDTIRWWLWPGNPRIFYLAAGALLVSGVELLICGYLITPWLMSATFYTSGLYAIIAGIMLVRWTDISVNNFQLRHVAEVHDQLERASWQAMEAIAHELNDIAEAKGFGRPIELNSVTFH